MKLLGIFSFLFATCVLRVKSEFFSATDELIKLSENDRVFVSELKILVESLEKETVKLRKKLHDMENEHKLMTDDPQTYVENPLNAFVLIKRLAYDVRQIPESIHKTTIKFMKNTKEITLSLSELDGSVIGIHRLQETYSLKSEDLSNGVIENKKYRSELSAEDLLILAEKTANMSLTVSDEYIKLARERNKDTKEFLEFEILNEIFKFYKFSAQYQKAIEVVDEIIKINAENDYYEREKINLELLLLYNENKTEEPKNNQLFGTHYTAPKEKLFYSYGCSGKIKKSIKEQSQLNCRYLSRTPFTKVAPFKIEEANLDPLIVLFHEILSDNEIDTIKAVTQSNFIRAATINLNNTNHVSDVRTSQLHWAKDNKHPIFERLTKRVADMSGLSMKSAEDWQLQNYGIGGHYYFHHDFTIKGQEFRLGTGNRIATNLFYLSDVEKGGATIFPLLRVYVPPRKGTSVFWYNLSTSGEREYMTRHASCPVLVGSKLVMNKWLHEFEQERNRPCELEPKPTDEKYYLKHYGMEDYGIKIKK